MKVLWSFVVVDLRAPGFRDPKILPLLAKIVSLQRHGTTCNVTCLAFIPSTHKLSYFLFSWHSSSLHNSTVKETVACFAYLSARNSMYCVGGREIVACIYYIFRRDVLETTRWFIYNFCIFSAQWNLIHTVSKLAFFLLPDKLTWPTFSHQKRDRIYSIWCLHKSESYLDPSVGIYSSNIYFMHGAKLCGVFGRQLFDMWNCASHGRYFITGKWSAQKEADVNVEKVNGFYRKRDDDGARLRRPLTVGLGGGQYGRGPGSFVLHFRPV